MAIKTNLKSGYVSRQAQVFMGPRVEHEYVDFDEDGIMQGKGGLTWMGNVSKASLNLTPEKFTHTESFSGSRRDDVVWTRKRGGTIELTIEDLTLKQNLSAMLGGRPRLISTGSATGVFFSLQNVQEPVYRPLKTGLPSTTNSRYFMVYRATNGNWYPYRNISSLVITDSAGSPATLVAGTNYNIVSPRRGEIEFTNVSGFTGPLKAAFTHGLVKDWLPTTINVDTYYQLSHKNVTSLLVKDSAGSPATVSANYYDVDNDAGLIKFKNLSGFEGANYTFPLNAQYTANDSTVIPFLADEPQREYVVMVKGIDTFNANAPMIWECYRVQWRPNTFELIDQDLGSATITGDLLQDPDMDPTDPIMGSLGKLTINKRDIST